MSLDRCTKCGSFWHETNRCTAKTYVVWCEEDGEDYEDGRTLYTHNAEDAAQEWAKQDDADSADYRIVGGEEVTVQVIEKVHAEAGGEADSYVVSGESVPAYYARKA